MLSIARALLFDWVGLSVAIAEIDSNREAAVVTACNRLVVVP
jgi:hypothetical protein